MRRAAPAVARRPGGLLPRLFTLTMPADAGMGGCFLSRYSAVTHSFPLGSMALVVARTFLSPLIASASDGPSVCGLIRLS